MTTRLRQVTDACATPSFVKSLNGWLTVAWIVMVPVALLSGLKSSLVFIVLISLWANIAGHFAGWVSGRVEVRQEEGA